MKRRVAIKQLLIVAGGIVILPSCSQDPSAASIALSNIDITDKMEALLAEITETILPATLDAPGSKDLQLHLFVLKMIDDCHNADDQQAFEQALKKIESDRHFLKLDSSEKERFITTALSNEKEELYKFFSITKRRTVQGFVNSKFVMTDRKHYELVPGRYNGFFPVPDNL